MKIRSARGVAFIAALALAGACSTAALAAADKPGAGSPTEITVIAAPKDKSHPHFGEGSPVAFVADGVQGRELILVRGKTYTFHVDTGAMHDFYLSSDARGTGIGTVTEGVTGNFTYRGDVTFAPGAETPDLVYYACRNHRFMGGTIHVVNPGEEGKVVLAAPVAAAKAKDRPVLDKNEVKQRLNFAEMNINGSEAAKRIAANGNEAAKAKYKAAQDALAAAKTAFAADDMETSKSKFEEALGLMKEAAKTVPSAAAQQLAKQRNADLVKGVQNLETSYRQNREAMASDPGLAKMRRIDVDKIHMMVEGAKALGERGQWEDANSILDGATRELSSALNDMLSNKTISYEMKFNSQAQEYEYEAARYASYEDLIPLAKEKVQPPPELSAKIEATIAQGKEKRDQANADAKAKDYAAALEKIKQGTDQLKTALMLLGVN